jgi:hypothetical protein
MMERFQLKLRYIAWLDPNRKFNLPEAVKRSVQEMMLQLTGKDIRLCPCCEKGTMRSVGLIPKGSGPSGFEILHPPGQ